MKAAGVIAVGLAVPAFGDEGSPIGKVIQMISDLQSKVIGEGESAQAEYDKVAELCEDTSRNLQNEIKTAKAAKAELEATIEEETSHIAESTTKIEELAASVATDEADLKAATGVRDKEHKDFAAEEAELVSTIDTINRAIGILEKELAKSGASMMQLRRAAGVADALTVLVQASALSAADGATLTALVQNSQQAGDADDDTGAPAAAAYEGKSGGIVDTLGDLAEKAETQLKEARAKEVAAVQNYNMLKQSLTDSIKFANKDAAAAKKSVEECTETKATAAGDLDVTSKDLAQDVQSLADLHHDCMTKAEDFEAGTKSRGEELAALAKAKEIIAEATGGAASFLQTGSSSDPRYKAAVRFVRKLSQKFKSDSLAQLSSRMVTSMRLNRGGDIFGKVKGLITDMIAKLEKDAAAAQTEKAYCDEELAESKEKKEDHTDVVEKLTSKIDQQTAKAAKLKSQVATLQKELAEIATAQATMGKLRAEEKAAFTKNEAETSKGLDGIQLALKVLREYYANADKAHSSSDGAAGGIVALLEVCEADFSKSLAEMRTTEETAAAAYEQETQENALAKTTKEKDAEYKEKEATQLAKSATEASSDRRGAQTELDAVLEYLGKLEDRCTAKAESYADRKAAREAEIAGLKEALEILEGEAALLQQSRRALRGVSRHH